MSALAIYLKNKFDVSGSDIAYNANTVKLEKHKIRVNIGHKISNIKNKDIIFYSSAIKNNPEIKEAKTKYHVLIDPNFFKLFAKINLLLLYLAHMEKLLLHLF